MKRFFAAVLWMMLASVLAVALADAQQPKKVPRIGLLSAGRPGPSVEAFRQGLRDLGYVEGKNITIEDRYAESKFERLSDLASDLVSLKVDVIFAVSTAAALATKNATKTIPIVFTNVADPIGSGLVASLAHPGGNITGLTIVSAELSAKRLELLKEVVPGVTRVAVLWHPGAHSERTNRDMLKQTEDAARALRVQLQLLEARNPDELDSAFSAMIRERAGAILVLTSPMFNTMPERKRIADLAAKSRLPTSHYAREFADAGGLMSYGANLADLSRRAATYVDKILKGTKPADLPVEQPIKFELIINLKAAKQIGLTIPPNVLARADKVIK